MVPRSTPVLIATIALAVVAAACGAAADASPQPPAPRPPVAQAPDPTPVLPPVVAPDPTPAVTPVPAPVATPPATPIVGDVDGSLQYPELTIELVDEDTVIASLDDPAAKAWRLVISGVGERGGDRWEILVETGDIAPIITATEIRDDLVTDVLDLSGAWDGTAVAGGCHSTLPVCLDTSSFDLPEGGDGHFSVRLDLPQAMVPLTIRGGTATWQGEPFVLGPWTDTEPFPWGEG